MARWSFNNALRTWYLPWCRGYSFHSRALEGSSWLQTFCNKVDEVAHPARVAPLVVVPRGHLHAAPVDHFGEPGVNDAGIRVAAEVDGDKFVRDVVQNAFQGSLAGGLLEGGIDLLRAGRLFDEGHQVHQRDVRRGHPHGVA